LLSNKKPDVSRLLLRRNKETTESKLPWVSSQMNQEDQLKERKTSDLKEIQSNIEYSTNPPQLKTNDALTF